jgi:hypothetical protein
LSWRIGMMKVGHESLRVWTIQPVEVWQQLQQLGELRVDATRLPYSSGYVPESYYWLTRQLRKRVPNWDSDLPWWVYCERPDLRQFRHCRPWGSQEVRLEIEPAISLADTFPVWAWNQVYTRQYLAKTRAEAERWEARRWQAVPDEDLWPLPDPWRAELESSWERLFDSTFPQTCWDSEALGANGGREGVLNCLRLDEVRNVTPFVGCDRRSPRAVGKRPSNASDFEG